MLDLSSSPIVMALAGLAILTLLVLLLGNRRPKRAEKWEKAEIMKQLLAASDREESLQQMKQAMKARGASPQPAMRQGAVPKSKPAIAPGASGVKPKVNVAAAGKAR
ncbi:MAG TPA: hypothetical protein VK466_17080 [Terriglobales bacterium]|nr:hypothetical protein [Terriglobales bacterium]